MLKFFLFFFVILSSCRSSLSNCEVINATLRNPELYKIVRSLRTVDSIIVLYDDSTKSYFNKCQNHTIKTMKTIKGLDTTDFYFFKIDPDNYILENKIVAYEFLENRYDQRYKLVPYSDRRYETLYMHVWRFYKLGLNKYYMVYRFRYSNVEGLVEIKKKKGKVVITKQYHRQ